MEIGVAQPSGAAGKEIETEAMLASIKQIVGFGIRRPGYASSLQVEHWLEAKFQELGLAEVRREPVPVNYWEPSLTSLNFLPGQTNIPCFPIPYTAWTETAGIDAPMVFIGEGNNFQNIELKGKIAVVEARFGEVTGAGMKNGSFFVRDAMNSIPNGSLHVANWLIQNFDSYHEAHRRGAAGFIGLLVDSAVDGCDFYVPYDGHLKGLPAIWIGRERAEFVRERSRIGERVNLKSLGHGRVVDSHNIIGVVPGKGRKDGAGNETILITCHHDAPFASAVEDASGIAVLLELAKSFANAQDRLNRDLIFVASSGHFHGGIGNRVFVEKHAGELLSRTVAAFGVEHIAEEVEGNGRGKYRLTDRPEVRALFFDGSHAFCDLLQAAAARHELDRLICLNAYSFGPEPPCDSAPFFTAGIPSACHISGPLYLFDPHDTLDKVRAKDLAPVARFFADAIRQIDSIPAKQLAEGMKRPAGSPPAALPSWFRPPPSGNI